MPRSQGLETEKEKVPHDRLDASDFLVEANNDVGAAQLLLGVLEQLDKRLLGAVAQLLASHVHVEPALPQDGVPRGEVGGGGGGHAELETLHERSGGIKDVVFGRRLGGQVEIVLGIQTLADGVRGIPYFPHSSALKGVKIGLN
jgi:hypothetical protein